MSILSALSGLFGGNTAPVWDGPITKIATKPTVKPTPPATGAYSAPAPAADPNAAATLYQINTGIDSANQGMARLGTQHAIGAANITNDYNGGLDKLTTQERQAEDAYKTGTTDQLNQFSAAKNKVNAGARNWMESATRTLGANGAGGGSAARYAVPNEANMQATAGNADAQAVNNHNIGALTSTWHNAQDQFTNAKSDLDRQKTQGLNDLESKIATEKANFLSTLAGLTGQKTIAQGGDYKTAAAAANPYTSQIPTLLSHIDSLAATPAINPMAVTLGKPDLSEYNFAKPVTPTTAAQDTSLMTPIVYNPFLGDPNQRQQQPVLAG